MSDDQLVERWCREHARWAPADHHACFAVDNPDHVDHRPLPWACPMCGTTSPPRETPAGTYCTGPCRQKLETCCEGAPAPERRT